MKTSTLESILVNKKNLTSSGKPCYQQQFTEDFLKKAKSATYVSLTDQVKIVLVVVNTVLYFNTYMSQKPSESEKYTLER